MWRQRQHTRVSSHEFGIDMASVEQLLMVMKVSVDKVITVLGLNNIHNIILMLCTTIYFLAVTKMMMELLVNMLFNCSIKLSTFMFVTSISSKELQ